MANFEKLIPVIEWLEAGAPHIQITDDVALTGFDYSQWLGTPGIDDSTGACGTTGCIAGAVVQLDEPIKFKQGGYSEAFRSTLASVDDKARELLDLTNSETRLLFYPFDLDDYQLEVAGHDDSELVLNGHGQEDDNPLAALRYATPQQIAVVLRHFVKTGRIEWHILEDEDV